MKNPYIKREEYEILEHENATIYLCQTQDHNLWDIIIDEGDLQEEGLPHSRRTILQSPTIHPSSPAPPARKRDYI
ncbi:hypothetical protein Tco_0143661 [Tanacetum coccineum]